MNESQLDTKILAETARGLDELHHSLLQSLKDKGPGLLLEVAVRVLKFPEDVREPLDKLQSLGLVEPQKVSASQFGSELYSLTAAGDRVLRLLNDPTFKRETQPPPIAPPASSPPSGPLDARRQEAELLNKLGDLAKEKGDLEGAVDFYKQALDITRELSSGGGSQ
ncbi:MAG: tetratricopeptide repeat protein [Blastocatellales bacterium]